MEMILKGTNVNEMFVSNACGNQFPDPGCSTYCNCDCNNDR